jgi:DNA-directed RNA polymerase specialized sigma24 family protein
VRPVPIGDRPSESIVVALVRKDGARDPAEAVALVANARRGLLLRVHRRRLRLEDLEDAYSQATLELVARARRSPFQSNAHIANALEQKFLSRIDDRRRAIGGRSAMEAAMATALPVDEPDSGAGDIEDRGAEVLRKVAGRQELQRLRELAAELTDDQRLVLACQVGLDMDCAEFCERFGWSPEKFRKVAQRARARLRVLAGSYQSGDRCRLLEPDILAYASRTADHDQAVRVTRHLENCRPCARHVADIGRASRRVAALLPVPLAKAGALAKLALIATAARRAVAFAGRPHGAGRGAATVGAAGAAAAPNTVAAGAGGGAFGAGGSLLGAGVAKLGIAAAVCIAGAAGGVAMCAHAGLLGTSREPPAHRHASRPAPVTSRAALVAMVNEWPAMVDRRPPRFRMRGPRAARRFDQGQAAQVVLREFGSPQRLSARIASAPTALRTEPVGSPLAPRAPAAKGRSEFGPEP